MTIPPAKAPLPVFDDDEDGNIRSLGKIRPAKKSGTSQTKGRPSTASRSLKSMSHAYGMNPNFNKATGNDFMQNDLISTNMSSREELAEALLDAKKRVMVLEANAASLRAENHRCENEVVKQHRRIEKLLDSTASQTSQNNMTSKASSGSAPLTEARRELEKSLLVRQLKSQIMILRSSVAEKEIEIETLKKSQKGTKIAELYNEKEEFYLETLRLKEVVGELRETLLSERQKKAWDKKRNGAGDEIRKEVARLTSGYRTVLKGIAQPSGGKSSSSRSKSASVINSSSHLHSKRSMTSVRGRTPSPSGEPTGTKLFHAMNHLDPIKTAKRPVANSWREDDEEDDTEISNMRHQSAASNSKKDELDYFNGISDRSSEKHFNGEAANGEINGFTAMNNNMAFESPDRFSSQASSEIVAVFISKIVSRNITSVERKVDSDISIILSFDSVWDTEISTLLEDGADMSLAFNIADGMHKNMLWHASLSRLREGQLKVTAIDKRDSSLFRCIGEGRARISPPQAFNKEFDAIVGTCGDVSVDVILVDKNGLDAGMMSFSLTLTSVAPFAYLNASESRRATTPAAPVAKFRLGEVVEGQFKGGDDWYRATVKAVNVVDYMTYYHLAYDDGDEEYDMLGTRIRPFKPPATLRRDDPPAPDTVTIHSAYSIGDRVEALYERGDDWYLANVKAVNSKGNFDLLYEDGDLEDDVSVGRMRHPVVAPVTPVKTSQVIFSGAVNSVAASSVKNDTPVCACGREIPFGYCEACNAKAEAIATIAEKEKAIAEAKAAEVENGPSSAAKRASLKSSEDAFLENYLDALSDDESSAHGLSGGPAVYGNLASSAKSSTVLEPLPEHAVDGMGEYKLNDQKIADYRNKKDEDDEGDYDEDFDS